MDIDITSKNSYLGELNDVQRKAVTTIGGPLMVIAGPGSGKTRVLTYRIAYLIENMVKPWNILALTFTNKAAAEMKLRLEKVVGYEANKVWAGTFHSLFAKILRTEAPKIGYPNDFTIYDTDDTKNVIKEIINTLKLDTKVYSVGTVRSRISSAKSNIITPKLYANNVELTSYDQQCKMPMIHKIYEIYEAKCKRAGAMDFDDLLLQMYRLLYENPEQVTEKYRNQFRYVLVDEFQDTNLLQYAIVKKLTNYEGSEKNFCIVGDDAQSIYSFRGATIENILQFQHDFPETLVYKLEQNYRSTKHIVEAANEIIANNTRQIKKKIWTDNIGDNKIKVIKAVSDVEEGKRVAELILEYKHRYNLDNSEFAILYRTNSQSRVFEENLRRINIPYRVIGGLSFYQRKEVKDVLAYLRLAVNPHDDEAFKRVVNYPKRGLGDTSIQKLISFANDNEVSIWQSIPNVEYPARTKNLLVQFVAMIQGFRDIASKVNAYDVVEKVVAGAGIMNDLKADKSPEGQARVENLVALFDGIKEFVEDDVDSGLYVNEADKSLTSYLQNIALITDLDENQDDNNKVFLMSVHAAKGLEFQAVFVVGLEENLFPSFMSMSSADQIDEERRLFYVAITRAEKHLSLSYSVSRYQYGNIRYNDMSRFLDELPSTCLEDNYQITKKSPINLGLGTPKVLPKFTDTSRLTKQITKVDPINFKPDNYTKIEKGQRVLHIKFGEGIVKEVDTKWIATIFFEQLPEDNEKRIMLKFAKLQILV